MSTTPPLDPPDEHGVPWPSRAAAIALIKLQAEWGVDEALSETPVDRRIGTATSRAVATPRAAASEPAPVQTASLEGEAPATAARPPPPARPSVSQSPPAASQAVRVAAQAAAATDLEALQRALEGFDDLALRNAATHTVRVDLGTRPRLIVVGEVADADEDRSGRPFAGPLGVQLDRMLWAIGLSRDDCALMPAIPWRPPGSRAPTSSEIGICTSLLLRRLELTVHAIAGSARETPPKLLLMGKLPLRMLVPDSAAERSRSGAARPFSLPLASGGSLDGLALAHPTMVLAQPALRRGTWHGLMALRERLTWVD